jgi:hypothetical protein
MKKTLNCCCVLLCLFFLLSHSSQAQQLKLGATPSVLEKSALLELNSDKQGLLLPRVNDFTTAPLNAAPDGMLIYYVPAKAVYIRKNSIWRKLSDETNTITSVNGQTGPVVTLTTNDIAESGNLYYTDARARSAFSAGTGISISGAGVISATAVSPTFTPGSVPFAGAAGTLTENNANFFWDFTHGRLGIGTNTPNNTLEVGGTNTTNGTSGLRLTNLGTATTQTYNNRMLSVDNSGNVIVTDNPAANNWLTNGNANVPAGSFLGTRDDNAMVIESNNTPFLSFGRRQTLGLVDGYTDYTDPNELVTYVQSALQFSVPPSVSFYKPKMWTNSDGNFRMKGPSAGTDYFEFGATGTNNNGGFDFIIGDDGDEPIVFKSYYYGDGSITEIMRLQQKKVGIGTNGAVPAQTLDVEGTMRMTGSAGTPNNILGRDNTTGDISNLAYDPYTLNITSGQIKANNTQAQWNANMLYDRPVSFAYPGTNQVLMFNGTQWAPQNVTAGLSYDPTTLSLTSGTLKANSTSAIWNASMLQGYPVSTTAPASGQFLVFDGTSWVPTTSSGGGGGGGSKWSTNGNSGTTPGSDFLGTTDAKALVVKTSNAEAMRVDATGKVGIRTTVPNSTLNVNGSLATGIVSYDNPPSAVTVALNDTYHTISRMSNDYHYIANITCNLPAASTCPGRVYVFCNTIGGSGSGKLYVTPNGTDFIGSLGNGAQMTLDERITATLQSSGSYWMVLYRGSSQGN